ncbi:hypothetical protein Q7P37_009519 [Cladosporium fusiforme]
MPPFRPFPFPDLSIGTDIAHGPRILNLVVQRRTFPRFLGKVLTTREQHHFYERYGEKLRRADTGNGEHWKSGKTTDTVLHEAARFLAGRWAAKEAIVKACTWRALTFDEIQVLKTAESGRVYGVILDKASERKKSVEGEAKDAAALQAPARDQTEQTGQVVKISISHDGDYATAVCLAAVEPLAGDVGGEAAAREMF